MGYLLAFLVAVWLSALTWLGLFGSGHHHHSGHHRHFTIADALAALVSAWDQLPGGACC
jgi:hypothetical protein